MNSEESYLITRGIVLLRGSFKLFIKVFSSSMAWDVELNEDGSVVFVKQQIEDLLFGLHLNNTIGFQLFIYTVKTTQLITKLE